MRVCILY